MTTLFIPRKETSVPSFPRGQRLGGIIVSGMQFRSCFLVGLATRDNGNNSGRKETRRNRDDGKFAWDETARLRKGRGGLRRRGQLKVRGDRAVRCHVVSRIKSARESPRFVRGRQAELFGRQNSDRRYATKERHVRWSGKIFR